MKYNLLKLLGKGSYAEVYLAINRNTSEKVAIKRFLRHNQEVKKSYYNELNILNVLGKTDCPYIVKLLDFYKDNQFYYIVMEYATHGDLETFINKCFKRNKYISEKVIDRIILQVNEALDVIHRNRIVHRDIKSANILIFDKKTVKIADFGVSKLLPSDNLARSSIGTPYYMSPAVIQGKSYSFNVDYWALGCLVYKMLINKYPFEANSIKELARKIKNSKFDDYRVPNKYLKLIRNLLNPNNENVNLIVPSIKERESEIKEFISYNCESFLNSPDKKRYFESKNSPYIKQFSPKQINSFSPKNKLPPLKKSFHFESYEKKINSPKCNNKLPVMHNYKPNYEPIVNNHDNNDIKFKLNLNYRNRNNIPRIEKNDFTNKINPYAKINPYPEINHYGRINHLYREKYHKVNQLNPISNNYIKNLNPPYFQNNYQYNEKKNENFLCKNFIKENKQNIRRINKFNKLIKNYDKNKEIELKDIIRNSSLKKIPKQYLLKVNNLYN